METENETEMLFRLRESRNEEVDLHSFKFHSTTIERPRKDSKAKRM